MPIENVVQPEEIDIDKGLRLKVYEKEKWNVAIPWYQNKKILYYSEGVNAKPYDMEVINRMYNYLSGIGELYFIEIFEDGIWKPIGDVTLSEKNMPIVIDEGDWGCGIGKKVISELIERAIKIKLKTIKIEIYKYNPRSRNLYTSLGFTKLSENETSDFYELKIEK